MTLKGLRTGILAMTLIATATAQPRHRLIIVIGQPNDPRTTQQHAALNHAAADLRERDVIVQSLTPETARSRPELGVTAQTTFEVLLIGKDGGVKLRRETPVPPAEITALIDTMPMRQSERRRSR